MQLGSYNKGQYTPGKPIIVQVLWHFIGSPLLSSWIFPFSSFKVAVLKLFGAQIGTSVRIKPGVKVKFPWRLAIGNHSWIGEGVWIDNLANVTIGEHSVVSQGAYLCTGNHNWNKPSFDLITEPITVHDHCWIAAKAILLPGAICETGSVLTAGSISGGRLESLKIYQGNPAKAIRDRTSHSR